MVTAPTSSSDDGQKRTPDGQQQQQTMMNGSGQQQQRVTNDQQQEMTGGGGQPPADLGQSFRTLTDVVNNGGGGHSAAAVDSSNDDDHRNLNAVIRDVKNVLMLAPPGEIATLFDGSILETLMKATSATTDSSALLDCSDIFDHCLRGIPTRQIFPRFVPQFVSGLSGNSPHVKSKFLQTIRKTIESDPSMIESILDPGPLFTAICRSLDDESTEVFEEAKNIMVLTAKHAVGTQALFCRPNSSILLAALNETMRRDGGKRFRIYELATDWSKISPDLLTFCVGNGLLTEMVGELASDDMLLKLNVLEMLTDMAIEADHCFDWLFRHDVLTKLYASLTDAQTPPYLFTGIIKLFGHLFKKRPAQCHERFPAFLTVVFRSISNYRSLDIGQRLLAFDSLGVLASTSDGKLILAKYDKPMRDSMMRFFQCIREGEMGIRGRHLEALSQIFYVNPVEAAPDQFYALCKQWFKWLGAGGPSSPSRMTVIFDILKQPFKEINGPAVELVKNLITQPWAQRLMVKEAGFLEYLISPMKEREPEQNRRRHELVGLFIHSQSAAQILPAEDFNKLQSFYDHGPHYRAVSNFEVAYCP